MHPTGHEKHGDEKAVSNRFQTMDELGPLNSFAAQGDDHSGSKGAKDHVQAELLGNGNEESEHEYRNANWQLAGGIHSVREKRDDARGFGKQRDACSQQSEHYEEQHERSLDPAGVLAGQKHGQQHDWTKFSYGSGGDHIGSEARAQFTRIAQDRHEGTHAGCGQSYRDQERSLNEVGPIEEGGHGKSHHDRESPTCDRKLQGLSSDGFKVEFHSAEEEQKNQAEVAQHPKHARGRSPSEDVRADDNAESDFDDDHRQAQPDGYFGNQWRENRDECGYEESGAIELHVSSP